MGEGTAQLARATQQANQAKVKAAQSGLAVLQEFGKSIAKAERSEADIGTLEDLAAFEREHGPKATYKPGELAHTGFNVGSREEIPAHEARPYLLERSLRDSILERSNKIRDTRERKDWIARQEFYAASMVRAATERASRETISYNIDRGQSAIKRAQENGFHDEAREVINTMPLTEEFRTELIAENEQNRELYRLTNLSTSTLDFNKMRAEMDRIENEESSLNPANASKAYAALAKGYRDAKSFSSVQEGDGYYAALRSESPEEVQGVIDHLQSDGYSGVLSEKERHTWITRLESGMKNINSARDAQTKAGIASLKRSIRKTSKLVADGEVLDPTVLNTAIEDVEQLRTLDPASDIVLDFDEALSMYSFSTEYQGQSLLDQADQLSVLSSDRSIEGIARYKRAQAIHKTANEHLSTDSMSYAERVGFFKPGHVLPAPESEQFVDALRERDWADRRIEQHFGKSSGPLRGIEVELLADYDGDPVELGDRVYEAMGDRAQVFWGQVLKSGMGARYVAGEIASRTDIDADMTARRVLAGGSYRKELEWTEGNYRQLRLEAGEHIGQAFGADMATRNAYLSAATDHYIAQVVRRGESQHLQPSTYGLNVDRDTLRDSVEAVTGGVVEWEGVTMLAPEPGVSTDQFEGWVESLKADDLPYVRQASRDELLERIQSGDIQLRQSSQGRDRFLLYDTYSGSLLSSAGEINEPAVLRWQ